MMMKKNVLRFLIVAAACLASSTTTARPEQQELPSGALNHEEAPRQNDISDIKVTITQGDEVKVNNDLPQVITTGDPTLKDEKSQGNVDQEIMIGETKVTLGNVDQYEVKDATEPTATEAGTSAAVAAQQYAVTLLLGAAGVFSLASMM